MHFIFHYNYVVGTMDMSAHSWLSTEQVTHYYPFGGLWGDLSTNQGVQPYKFGGKELDRMYGYDLYDFGARNYDPAIARFTGMDPLAEKYYHLTPYAYCANNPVNYIDPEGIFMEQSKPSNSILSIPL